jgi:hypothetical protein
MRAARRRRYGWAALRALRGGLRAAMAAHLQRSIAPAHYNAAAELKAIKTAWRRGRAWIFERWPALSPLDARAEL